MMTRKIISALFSFFLMGATLFAQENNTFARRLSYIDIEFSNRKVAYNFSIEKKQSEATENYAGEYLLSSKGERMTITNIALFSEAKISQELEAKILSIIDGINFIAFTPYTKFIKTHLDAFDCVQISENKWKLTAIASKMKEILNYPEHTEYYFLVNLNSDGEVVDIETHNLSNQKGQNSYHIMAFYKKEDNRFCWDKIQGEMHNNQTGNILKFAMEMQ